MAQALPLFTANVVRPRAGAAARTGWSLHREAFEELLWRLDPDRDRAGEKYSALHRKLCRFFEGRRCPRPEDCADETLDRIARRLASGERVDELNGYVFGVARMVGREVRKRQHREREALASLRRLSVPSAEEPAGECYDQLERCFGELPRSSLELILAYYEREKSAKIRHRHRLARDLGISRDALRSRAHRVRDQLRRAMSVETGTPAQAVAPG
jgi:DNA-directed RNA polymerase specialized sigma24 family protein